jgi:flavodoxin
VKETKSLIAYYSRKGNNYIGGSIVNLPIGNTEVAANMIQQLTGSDTFRIETIQEYLLDYTKTTEIAQQELLQNARPQLTESVCGSPNSARLEGMPCGETHSSVG